LRHHTATNYPTMASRIRTMLTKLFGTPEYRLLIMGLDASGKTTILYKLKLNEIVTTIPTIGFNVETMTHNNTTLTIWDVGGRDKIRPLMRHYFQNTQGLIFVVDSHDRDRLEEATEEMKRVLMEDELREIPMLIYLNKIDRPHGLKQDDVIKEMRLNTIRDRQWFLQPCSACTGDGLHEGLNWLIHAVNSPLTSQLRQANTGSSTSTTVSKPSYAETKSLEWLSQQDDDTNEEFVEKFQKHQLSAETFDHRALLRTIWSYLTIHGRKETIKGLFDNLETYVTDVNETLIYFWIQIVHYASAATKNPTNDFTGFLLMNPQILNESELPLTYYKKDTLFSNQAKTTIVLPNLKQLPSILPSSHNPVERTGNSAHEQSVNELEDDEFLKQFESCTLTHWSHKTHLRMVWLYLTRDGRRVAVNKIFDGIKNFSNNSQLTRITAFHFTMTYFWIQMTDLAIAQSPKNISFEEFLRINPHLLNESLFLEYYKKETILNNPIAREEMVLPDIKPLPTLVTSNSKK
jgi:ADP-ribosylation factor protein 1